MIKKTINSENCLLNLELIEQVQNAKYGVALVQALLESAGSGSVDQDAIRGAWETLDSVRGLLDDLGRSPSAGQ